MIMGAQALRRRAKEFGVGRALYRYYHLPIGVVEKSIREGGPLAQRRTELGRRDMLAAAADLPPLNMAPATGVPPEVHFLTGKKYWYQTLFCFYSLQINSPFRITPVLYDDGTLGPAYVGHVPRRGAMGPRGLAAGGGGASGGGPCRRSAFRRCGLPACTIRTFAS